MTGKRKKFKHSESTYIQCKGGPAAIDSKGLFTPRKTTIDIYN